MDMFKMIKEAAAMRSKLSEMEKALKSRILDVEYKGVQVKINAKGEPVELKLSPEVLAQGSSAEKIILSAFQQAIKKSQDVMAEEAKKITGGLKIPGLM